MIKFLIGLSIMLIYALYNGFTKVIYRSDFGLGIMIVAIIDTSICYYVGDAVLFRYEYN
jgi:hypothetical protein